MSEGLLVLPSVAFWLLLLLRRLIPVLMLSGFLGIALGGGLLLQFILLLVDGRGVDGSDLFHGVLQDFSCHRPKRVDGTGVRLGVGQCRCVAGLRVSMAILGIFLSSA